MGEMTIGDVARLTGLPASAIRYYEQVGLLSPARRRSNQRRYDADILGRIGIVRTALEAGFTIAEARLFIAGFPAEVTPSSRWQALATSKLKELDALMQRTRKMKQLLETSFKCGCVSFEDCEGLYFQARQAGR